MTRQYQVQAVELRDRIFHYDFFRPRNEVTLVRLEDGTVMRILMPTRSGLKRGDVIRLDDRDVCQALQNLSEKPVASEV